MKKALFLDRDGVINIDCAYPHKPEQIIFSDGIFSLCKKALSKGYLLIVVTNQAGVAKGYFTEDDVKRLHDWMQQQFSDQGIKIDAFYYCPFHPDAKVQRYKKDSDCRKPKPGMILQALKDFNIDISKSLMVGDKESDRILLAGLRSVIVKSRYSAENYDVASLAEIERLL